MIILLLSLFFQCQIIDIYKPILDLVIIIIFVNHTYSSYGSHNTEIHDIIPINDSEQDCSKTAVSYFIALKARLQAIEIWEEHRKIYLGS